MKFEGKGSIRLSLSCIGWNIKDMRQLYQFIPEEVEIRMTLIHHIAVILFCRLSCREQTFLLMSTSIDIAFIFYLTDIFMLFEADSVVVDEVV